MSSSAVTTTEVTMSIGSRLFALMYDRMSDKVEKAGLGTLREQLLSTASGRVLEIGGGTGAHLRHYCATVESLTVTEPEPAMLKRLQRRAQAEGSRATILRA